MPMRIQDLTTAAAVVEATDIMEISQIGRTPSSRKITVEQLLAGPYYQAGLKLSKALNLSDLASAATARNNLGLGSAATHAATDFDEAGAAAAEQDRAEEVENILKTYHFTQGGGTITVGSALNASLLTVANGAWAVEGSVQLTFTGGGPATGILDFAAGIGMSALSMGGVVRRYANSFFQLHATDVQIITIPLASQVIEVGTGTIGIAATLYASPGSASANVSGSLVARRIS